MSKKIGIDIGNKYIRAIDSGSGTPVIEPAAFALNIVDGGIIACGTEAIQFAERTPGNVRLIYPFSGDTAPEKHYLSEFINYILQKVGKKGIARPKAAVAISGVPDKSTEQLCLNTLVEAGAKDVYMVDTLFAAATGANINFDSDSAILNVGASVTDMAVISHGSILTSRTITMAGNEFDAAIADYVLRKYKIRISEKTAENIKLEIGSLRPARPDDSVEVTGVRTSVGIPRLIKLKAGEIAPVLEEALDGIVDALLAMLNEVSLTVDMIILTGGGAQLRGLRSSLAELAGIETFIAHKPELCVLEGIRELFESGRIDDISEDE